MRRRLTMWVLAAALLGAGRAAPMLLTSGASDVWGWTGLPGCQPDERSADQWKPLIVNADRYVDETYRCDGGLVSVHVGEFFAQRPGKEAVGGSNRITEAKVGEQWKVGGVASGLGFDVNAYRFVNHRGQEVVVWQWYSVGSDPVASEGSAKLAEARQLLKLEPLPSAQFLVAVMGPLPDAEGLLQAASRSLWLAYLERRP